MSSCGSATTMRLMTVLSSRGRLVPVGGWPTAEADLLCWGCERLALVLSRRRDGSCCEGLAEEGAARCEELRGGGIGAPVVVGVECEAGEFCVDGGSGWARGEVTAELCDTAGEW